jgi:Lrp/AsnC family transcriptional regulator
MTHQDALAKVQPLMPTFEGRKFRDIGLEGKELADDLDPVDARILDILQHDASLSVAEVAERVGLSASPCWRRIKRLEDSGVIRKRVTILDPARLGLDFEVYAIVKLNLPSTANLDVFERAVADWPEVVQCATITGREDYVLRIVTSDMHAFDSFLREKLLALGIVSDCESHIVTRGVKDETALPLSLAAPNG